MIDDRYCLDRSLSVSCVGVILSSRHGPEGRRMARRYARQVVRSRETLAQFTALVFVYSFNR